MCGIIGYVGKRCEAQKVIIDGLKWLEYRGYDSAGIATIEGKKISVTKKIGSVSELLTSLSESSASIGVGHTRWATHGNVSELNAHPFVIDDIALVHNGIIENYDELLTELKSPPTGQTDSEVVACLIAQELKTSTSLVDVVSSVVRRLVGSYAIAVIRESDKSAVVAKRGSPLVIGVGQDHVVFASDVPAIIHTTCDIMYLVDGDVAELHHDNVTIFDSNKTIVQRELKRVERYNNDDNMGSFEHTMLKEIYEQPDAIEKTLRKFLEQKLTNQSADVISKDVFKDINQVIILGMGTSYHAAILGRYWFESIAGIRTSCEIAAEFRYRNPVISNGDLVILMSQSGETADTIGAAEFARAHGAKILSITNVVDSTLSRISDHNFYTQAGFEIGVASTKAFTTQLVSLLFLASVAAEAVNNTDDLKKIYRSLRDVSTFVRTLLNNDNESLFEAVKILQSAPRALFLGRGVSYPIAMEGALKLKEISYIHAEAYSFSEMKHGPIALIGDPSMPVVALISSDQREKSINNLHEIRSRGAKVIGVVCGSSQKTMGNNLLDVEIPVDCADHIVQPVVVAVVLQLIAYYVAKSLGREIDKPRNLAKVVTVE